jgi:MFS family permease
MSTETSERVIGTSSRPGVIPASSAARTTRLVFVGAWILALIFYFLQYALRSAPGVMIPELRNAFGLTPLSLTSLLGLYFYTYAGFAIIAGAALDRYGAKLPIGLGVFAVAVGSILFGMGSLVGAEWGRLLQGAGSGFAFPGAVYLAAHAFSSRWLATAMGFTQFAGMLGGFAGQFVVGPLVHGVVTWQQFWLYAGVVLVLLSLSVLALVPRAQSEASSSIWSLFAPYKVVLTNPQSYVCGLIGGLMFIPTMIGNMIWGVPFRETMGVSAAEAVARSSMVPLGWVIGAPLLGYVADKVGRRKPVLLLGLLIMLGYFIGLVFFPENVPPYTGGLLFGIGSGAAMIPYTMIKEVNPDKVKGSAAGAMNFLVFGMSAILGPLFGLGLHHLSSGHELTLKEFQEADWAWLGAVVVSLLLLLVLRETGSAANPTKAYASNAKS